jgi:hypothetical protein
VASWLEQWLFHLLGQLALLLAQLSLWSVVRHLVHWVWAR